MRSLSAATIVRAVPGMLAQFSRPVPVEHHDGGPWRSCIALLCSCGAYVRIRRHGIAECDCGRFIVRTRDGAQDRLMCAYPAATCEQDLS